MKRFFAIILTTLLLASCGTSSPKPDEIKTIVSLTPNMTEIVYFLNMGERLIGRTNYCNYPPECLKVESVGDPLNLRLERIVELKPDLVLVNRMVKMEDVNKLKEAGLYVEAFDPQTIEEIFSTMDKIADLCGVERNTDELRVECAKYKKDKPTGALFYMEIWDSPATTFGKNTLGSDLINWIGGKNIGDDLQGEFPTISKESLVALDPDIIIYPQSYKPEQADFASKGFGQIKAVKNAKVFALNDDLMMRPSPRVFETLKILTQFAGK